MNEKVKCLRAIVDDLATIRFEGDEDALVRDEIMQVLDDLYREQQRLTTRARFYLFTESEDAMRAETKRILVASGEWGDGAEDAEVQWSEWVGEYSFNGHVLAPTIAAGLEFARQKYGSHVATAEG